MKKSKLYLLGVLLCLTSGQIFSQTENSNLIKTFGIGLHLEQFKINDFSDLSSFPANKIVFTVNTSNRFRMEPEIGVRFGKDDESGTRSSSISLGLGLLGMWQRSKVNFYGGFRFEYGGSSSTTEGNSGDGPTNKATRLGLGPALGAEYFLGENFSFGGEVGLKYVSMETSQDPESEYFIGGKSHFIATETGLFVRLYL